ncbi:BppU family phage baseplate upper protein [Enterococcus faecium]|uniref:BppU family phage baseplate upper protein n=1 Tax=Enterococcus faecium TaxID=1352 RepID=UPI0039FC93DC
MAHVIKKGSIKVPTQPKDYDLQATGLVFKSYDNQIALEFNVEQQNGTPADLLGANLRLLMFIYDEVDGMITKEPIPFITKNLITESFLNGQVVYILPEAMKAYNGMVEAYVYIEYPDGSTSDNLGFTFRMKRSAIDGLAQDKADYFIADFQQLLDGVKQETTDAVNEALAKVEAVSKNVSSAQNDLTILEDRIDQTNQQIGDLGKLKKMYSNSIDFGDYDYSGRANLMPSLDFSKLSSANYTIQTPPPYIKDGGTHFVLDASDESAANTSRNVFIPLLGRLEKGAHYAVTIPMMVSEDFGTDYGGSQIYPYNVNDGVLTTRPWLMTPNADCRGKWQFIKQTFTVPSNLSDGKFAPYLQVYQTASQTGKLYIGYDIKIEKVNSISDTATPYQPNLLDAPYYLSKVALGENLIKPESQQPVTNSNYLINTYNIKPMVKGKKYTITLEGTKPATQVFRPFFTRATGDAWEVGDLQPVEGLTDVWSKTFTAADDSHPTTPQVQIYQVPSTSVGQCTIKWLKLEEGDTRTPNISEYKYFGEGLKDSNNPNDYSWDITPEYTEKGLNDSVSLTEPETVLGLKNFEDGLQIAGKEVATVPEDTGWVNLTAINGHSWNKQGQIRRIGKLVMFRGSLKGSTLSTQDFCTIPEGFRPSNPTDNYEYQFLLPPQSSNTLDNGGMAYIRPNGVCGLPSFRGTVNLFLAPIQYYID